MRLEETFNAFLLKHQQRNNRTLNFLILMEAITTAAKYINYFYNYGAINNYLSGTGEVNIQGENVMQLDEMANEISMHYLKSSEQVIEAISEESEKPVELNPDGRYLVYFDPLDGSSNVKHSLPVGFVFGVAKKNLQGPEDRHLRKGKDYICAGMFLIPSGVFTFALKNGGCWSFIMDKTGVFIRPSKLTFPEDKKTWELSWNASQRNNFSKATQSWVKDNEEKYAFRYAGAMAMDVQRVLKNGGMFMYPAVVNHPNPKKNYPNGKLRLMYECNVMAFLAKEAGGFAIDDNGQDILEIEPKDPHQRSSIYVGNKILIEEVRNALLKKST